MAKDSAARVELGRSLKVQPGTFNFVCLWDGTIMCHSLAECKPVEGT